MSSDYVLAKRPLVSDSITSPVSPSGPYGASRSTTALSTKVSSILSASYADLEIRDALSLLDQQGIVNNAETRRQLRSDVQKDVIQSNGDVIREFGRVADQLRKIGITIVNLNQNCLEMRQSITAAYRETMPVIEEASDLMTRKDQVEKNSRLLKAFSEHFIMSNDDVAILTSTAEPVNDEFFIVLSRAKKIQVDCRILLGAENQSLGLEIMDQTSKNLNGAFQKLYRWIQREFKSLDLENPQISFSIRRALRVLAERPSLFHNCLDFFAEAREHILSDAFYTALTGTLVTGGQNTGVKPIELVAHDPLRYVGDMLAWTHSATVSEREALEALFISDGDEIAKGIQAGRDNEPWNKYLEEDESKFDGHKALNELVDRDVAGVARVLHQRIEQVVQSHEETIMVYKIANLMNFYRITFSKLLARDSILLDTLRTLEDLALQQFRSLMQDHIAGLQGELPQPSKDLSPPVFLQEGLKQLLAIMKTFETSFTAARSREAEFRPILAVAFEPYLKVIEDMAETLGTPNNAMFAINCMLTATSVLSPYDFTMERVAELQKRIEQYSVDLIEYQYAFYLQSSGLQPLLNGLGSLTDGLEHPSKIKSLDVFQPQVLMEASQNLDDFLPSALMDAMENLQHLQSARLARELTEEAADRFCEDFEHVEESIVAASGVTGPQQEEEGLVPSPDLRALFPRTSGEIRVLLS